MDAQPGITIEPGSFTLNLSLKDVNPEALDAIMGFGQYTRQPSSYDQWCAFFDRLDYKRNVYFKVVDIAPPNEWSPSWEYRHALHIEMEVENTVRPGDYVTVIHRFPILPFTSDATAMDTVRRCVHAAEAHESDEWLKLDGRIVHNPHR